MGIALSLFALMTITIFIVRVASVALRLTGLEEATAKFQALSAVSGTGFTTRESETIVNYPVRRWIVSLLMIIGNLGLVTMVTTLVAAFVRTDGQIDAVLAQVGWLFGMLLLLWFLMLNKVAERMMCALVSRTLKLMTSLGTRHFHRLLQVGDEFSVCEHPISSEFIELAGALDAIALNELGLTVLAVRTSTGKLATSFSLIGDFQVGDRLVLFGVDSGHEALDALGR